MPRKSADRGWRLVIGNRTIAVLLPNYACAPRIVRDEEIYCQPCGRGEGWDGCGRMDGRGGCR
jgi:hypothetical protein